MIGLAIYIVGILVSGIVAAPMLGDRGDSFDRVMVRVLVPLVWPVGLPIAVSWWLGDRLNAWLRARSERRRELAARKVTPAPLADSKSYREVQS